MLRTRAFNLEIDPPPLITDFLSVGYLLSIPRNISQTSNIMDLLAANIKKIKIPIHLLRSDDAIMSGYGIT